MQSKMNVFQIICNIAFILLTLFFAVSALINPGYITDSDNLISLGMVCLSYAAIIFVCLLFSFVFRKGVNKQTAIIIEAVCVFLMLFSSAFVIYYFNLYDNGVIFDYSLLPKYFNLLLIVLLLLIIYILLRNLCGIAAGISMLVFGFSINNINDIILSTGKELILLTGFMFIVLLFYIGLRLSERYRFFNKYRVIYYFIVGALGSCLTLLDLYVPMIIIAAVMFNMLFKRWREAFAYIAGSAFVLYKFAGVFIPYVKELTTDGSFFKALYDLPYMIIGVSADTVYSVIFESEFSMQVSYFVFFAILTMGALIVLSFNNKSLLHMILSYILLFILFLCPGNRTPFETVLVSMFGYMFFAACCIQYIYTFFSGRFSKNTAYENPEDSEDERYDVLNGEVFEKAAKQEGRLEDVLPIPIFDMALYGDESGCIILNGNKYNVSPEIIEAYNKRKEKAHEKYNK